MKLGQMLLRKRDFKAINSHAGTLLQKIQKKTYFASQKNAQASTPKSDFFKLGFIQQ